MQQLFRSLFLTGFFSFVSVSGLAQEATPTPQQFQKMLPPGSTLAIQVSNAKGQTLMQQNSQQLLAPASILKLLTALSSYYELGTDFRFDTSLYADRDSNNLILRFTGDPLFDRAALRELLAQAQKEGLKTINGDLLLDGSVFRGHNHAPGQNWADMTHCFAAPASAISLDHSCLVAMLPEADGFSQPQLPADLEGIIEIEGGLKPVSTEQQKQGFCEPNISKISNSTYRLEGCIDKEKLPLKLELSAPDPIYYSKALIKQQLDKLGINLKGGIRVGPLPDHYRLLAKYRSQKLNTYIQQMLLDSDNTIADVLLKTMGAKVFNQAGNYKNGVAAMRNVVEKACNIDLGNSAIADGSGLSRLNLLTVATTDQLLQHIQQMPDSTIRDALPLAGQTGTLKNRYGMEKAPLKGNVLAKTGTLSGTYNMAGFIRNKRGELLNVSVFVSGFNLAEDIDSNEPHNERINSALNRFYGTVFTELYQW